MGNEVSLPPIIGNPNPSVTVAINRIITELNSIFSNSSPAPQYLLSFATELKSRITDLTNIVDDLLNNAPSPQAQITLLQGQIAGIISTFNNYMLTNNATVDNLSQSINTINTYLNNLLTSVGSVNVVALASDLSDVTNNLNNAIASLNNKVDKTTTVNNKALSTNIVLTPADIGLGQIDNTSDVNKPISTATQAALDNKVDSNPSIISNIVGTATSVPVIHYDSKGLIISGGNTAIAITPNQASLGNVQNVDTTLASNIQVDQPLSLQTNTVTQGDDLLLAVSKLQNQTNDRIPRVVGSVLDKIAVFDSLGNVKNSLMNFNDLGTSVNEVLSASAVINKINSAVTGVLNFRGTYVLSGSTYPSTGGSGVAGAVLKGDLWYASGSSTLGGNPVNTGDAIIALIDSPGQISNNWNVLAGALSYTPEDQGNKTNTTMSTSSVLYPTVGLVKSYVDAGVGGCEPSIPLGLSTQYLAGDKNWYTLDKAAVGLSSVTNDAQLKRSGNDINTFTQKTNPVILDVLLIEDSQDSYNKKRITIDSLPVSTNLNSSLNNLVPQSRTINGYDLSTDVTLSQADVGLSNVDNTTDLSKPISNATQVALNNKADRLNLGTAVTVGTNRKVPVITYNTDGQITTSSEVDIALTKADVGLGNVINVDNTDLSNVTLQGSFITSTTPIVTGDTGKVVAQKTQGQLNAKADLLSPASLGAILVSDVNGNISDSHKTFNDAGTGLSHILSAYEIDNRIAASISGGSVTLVGTFTPVIANTFPSSTASAGSAWRVIASGTVGTTSVVDGDVLIAQVDNPGNTQSNWIILQAALGYTAENTANKETSLTTSSNIKYPTSKAVADYVTSSIGSISGLPSGGTTSQYLRGDSTWQTLNASAVGLGNVTNNAQVKRSSDYGTFPTITAYHANDVILVEDSTNSAAKSSITLSNIMKLSNLSDVVFT